MRNQGCPSCGTQGEKTLSDREFAKKRIPHAVALNVNSLRILNTAKDRSNLKIELCTKHFRYQGLLKHMPKATSNLLQKTDAVMKKHGEWVTIFMDHTGGICNTSATCKISGKKSSSWSTVMRGWTSRIDPKARARITAKHSDTVNSDDLFKLRASESEPSRLVRDVISEMAGPYLPETEVRFAGLVGDKRHLRVDLYYKDWNCVVEVQSILHEQSVEGRGGDAAFKKRVEYDEIKRVYFEKQKATGVRFFAFRGDKGKAHVQTHVRKMIDSLGLNFVQLAAAQPT